VAGEQLSLNLTSIPDLFLSVMTTDLRFSPYERGMVYLNYTTPEINSNGTISFEPVPLVSIAENITGKF
jgi:hypothetical protein